MIFQKILEQKRNPLFTAISLLTTALAMAIIVVAPFLKYQGWGALAAIVLPWMAMCVGIVVNGIAGLAAYARGEYCGGRIALLGIGLLALTEIGFIAWKLHQLDLLFIPMKMGR